MATKQQVDPLAELSASKLKRGSFLRLGDGLWTGTVYDPDGVEHELTQLASGHWDIQINGSKVRCRTLAGAMAKVGG